MLGLAKTSGNGLWSKTIKEVPILSIEFNDKYKEVRVFFDSSIWDVKKDGLIYTDTNFLIDVINLIKTYYPSFKFADKLDYTEAGMQGNDYVSLEF